MAQDKPLIVQISPTRALISNPGRWMELFPEDKNHSSGGVVFTSDNKDLDGCSFTRTGVVVDFSDDGAMTLFCLKYL